MDGSLERLLVADGSWNDFEADWRDQCENFGEDFDQYAIGSLPVLKSLAADQSDDTRVMALKSGDGSFSSVLMLNRAVLPGYAGHVLRVRHMLLSPSFDFGEHDIEQYASVLSATFSRAVGLAFVGMPAKHVKFHMRSPTEYKIFSNALTVLSGVKAFTDVAIRGAWLYLSLNTAGLSVVSGESE